MRNVIKKLKKTHTKLDIHKDLCENGLFLYFWKMRQTEFFPIFPLEMY